MDCFIGAYKYMQITFCLPFPCVLSVKHFEMCHMCKMYLMPLCDKVSTTDIKLKAG